jgi:hypothetical protein
LGGRRQQIPHDGGISHAQRLGLLQGRRQFVIAKALSELQQFDHLPRPSLRPMPLLQTLPGLFVRVRPTSGRSTLFERLRTRKGTRLDVQHGQVML